MSPLSQAARDQLLARYHHLWGVAPRPQRNPAPQPVSLSRADVPVLLSRPYMVADKTDGVRTVLFLSRVGDENLAVLVDRKLEMTPVPVAAHRRYFDGTVFDGELVAVRGSAGRLLLVFDTIAIKGESWKDRPFTDRSAAIRKTFDLGEEEGDAVTSIAQAEALARRGKILAGTSRCGLTIKPKACFHAGVIGTLVRSLPGLPYATDGLIFTPVEEPVRTGTHARLFKLKEVHSLDVECRPTDGLLLLGAGGGPATAPLRVDAAEVGLRPAAAFWDAARRLGLPAEGGIVECLIVRDAQGALLLRPERMRTDKEHPNSRSTASRTLAQIEEGLTIAEVVAALEGQNCGPSLAIK